MRERSSTVGVAKMRPSNSLVAIGRHFRLTVVFLGFPTDRRSVSSSCEKCCRRGELFQGNLCATGDGWRRDLDDAAAACDGGFFAQHKDDTGGRVVGDGGGERLIRGVGIEEDVVISPVVAAADYF